MADPKWIIERLGKQHERGRFDCGVSSLNEFLKTLSGQFEKRDLGRTFAAARPKDPTQIVGYYTLAGGSVSVEVLPPEQRSGLPQRMSVPVLHLGRLAVSKTAQGEGLGAYLLMDALARGHHAGRSVAMRAVEVVAINEEARRFYLKYGFVELADDRMHLYLPMKKIAKLFPDESVL